MKRARSVGATGLEGPPVFGLSDQNDWMGDAEGMQRIGARARSYRAYTDNLEPLFQNDSLVKIFERTNGDSWLEGNLGAPGSTSRRCRAKDMRDPRWGRGATR
jgi:hypothetical protein